MKEKITLPSAENRRLLKEFTDELKPDDVKFLLALNADSSVEECMDDAVKLVSGLKKYIKGNHSKENVSEYFGTIEVF